MRRPAPQSKPPSIETKATRWPASLAWLALFVLVFAAYLLALHGDFLWDDLGHVTRPDLRTFEGLFRIWFEIGATQQYYPLLHSAFWLEHQLWGDAVVGYHLINLLQHATAAFLLGLVLKRLAVPGAWLAAGLFALHPVCVESVAWISEQKNTLSVCFYLGAALAWLRFEDNRRPGHYALATGLFVLALLTKTVTASLPAALLVITWWRHGRLRWRAEVLPLLPWFAAGAAMGLLTVHFEHELIGAQGSDFELGLGSRALLAARVPWHYLWSFLAPFDLTFIYPRWTIDPAIWWQWLFALATLALLITGMVLARRGRRTLLAVALLFGGTLFPVLGFVNVFPFIYSFVADHFQYHASLVLFALAGTGLALLRTKLTIAGHVSLIAALGLGFGALTWHYAGSYRNSEALYRATIARNPACWMAHNNLGIVLVESGRVAEALPHYEVALRLRANYAEAEHNYGLALNRLGRFAEALPRLERAVQLRANYAEAQNELGVALMSLNRTTEGRANFDTALRLRPDYGLAHRNLGLALASAGNVAAAMPHFSRAAELLPTDPEAQLQFATALLVSGRRNEAVTRFQQALALDPNNAVAHLQFAHALRQLGRTSEANHHHQTAVSLDPSLSR